jgi:N-acetylneuraminic acid mutarotase
MQRHGCVVGSPMHALARRVGAGMLLTLTAGLVAAGSAVAAPNAWTAVGSLSTGRIDSAVAVLPSGKVMLVGGSDGTGPSLASSEIYDPATHAWSAAGAMPAGRGQAAAVTLQNGQVLVVGGETDGSSTDPTPRSALLYDPSHDTFTPTTGTLRDGRTDAGITLLPDGNAMVIGGYDPAYGLDLATTEIYHPSTGAFTPGPSMRDPRERPMVTALADGDILVAGGADFNDGQSALDTAEVFDPHSRTWSDTETTMSTTRTVGGTALLPDGRVLVAGGVDADGDVLSSTDVFDPATKAFTSGAAMAQPRAGFGIASLANGNVLVAGGLGAEFSATAPATVLASTEIYDPTADTWSASGDLPTGVVLQAMVSLADGEVLEAGGSGDLQSVNVQAAVFDPAFAQSAPTGVTTTPGDTTPPTDTTATTTNPLASTPPAGTAPPRWSHPPRDRAATLRLSGLASRMTLRQFLRGLGFKVTPSKAVALKITVTGTPKRRALSPFAQTLASARLKLAPGRRTVKLVPARRLVGHPRSVKVLVTVVATDAAGTRTQVTRTLTIRG